MTSDAVPEPGMEARRVWVRGRPVLGFVGGLVFGLGVALILLVFNVWALSDLTFFVFPLATAVIGGIRGAIGRAYRVSFREAQPPPVAPGMPGQPPVAPQPPPGPQPPPVQG